MKDQSKVKGVRLSSGIIVRVTPDTRARNRPEPVIDVSKRFIELISKLAQKENNYGITEDRVKKLKGLEKKCTASVFGGRVSSAIAYGNRIYEGKSDQANVYATLYLLRQST